MKKRCPRCGVEKPVEQFYRNKSTSDGLCGYCVLCWKGINKTSYAKNAEKEKARRRVWYKENRDYALEWRRSYYVAHRNDPAFKKKASEMSAKYNKRHRWSYRECANKAVALAIRCGAIERQPCEKCGGFPANAHHHKGYDLENWFSVQWLCHVHHNEVHGRRTYSSSGG